VRHAGGGHGDERAAPRRTVTHDEASVDGVFPHGKAWTRGLPGVEYLGVGAGVGAHPLKEVEDQGVDGAGQGVVSYRASWRSGL